jgi:hypothetical protein
MIIGHGILGWKTDKRGCQVWGETQKRRRNLKVPQAIDLGFCVTPDLSDVITFPFMPN